ncbi:retrovirus-related pol polyprotein from transposon TNT 1-94 [Tanacetum coccineum]
MNNQPFSIEEKGYLYLNHKAWTPRFPDMGRAWILGHAQDVNSICWDPSNARLASVSHESAQVWASTSAGWKCVYSLTSGGHVYTSCLFHPLHPQLLIIGTYQYIQLWDTSNGNKSKLFQSVCSGFVSALTCFPESGLVVSASRDSQALFAVSPPLCRIVARTDTLTLTAELERYKEQVKVLKEGQNVDLRSNNNVSDSSAQSVEIDRLKQTLSEHLKEKESLMQTVTLLKNDFKKEESRNIDREIALEKKIKQLDNIVFKRDQSAQTVHMLTKPQFFYDHTTKQALGFQNPFYLKKAQQLRNSVNSPEPTLSSRPTKVEVPKELLKVSMVNTSLKKLKYHLAGFDMVVKERTIPTAITEGSWGFEHTKACFRDEIIPFVKVLKEFFNTFNQYLIDELSKVQNFFHQIEQAVEQHRVESKTFEEIFQRDNSFSNQSAPSFDQLFELNELKAQSQEKDTIIKKLKERIKSLSGKMNEDKIKKDLEEIETINIELDHRVSKLIAKNEHLKQTYKQLYDSIKPARIRSKEQCDDLINQVNLKSAKIFDLNASLWEKVLVITARKDDLKRLKGKALVDNATVLLHLKELLSDFINNVNTRVKSKSIKKSSKKKVWKPTGKVFTNIGYIWRPTARTFTIVGNACPLTRITTTTEVPLRKPTILDNEIPKPVVTLVYSQKPRKSKINVPASKSKVVQIVLWYLDFGYSKHITRDRSQLTNFVNKFLGTVKFGNDHVAKILGYGDYQIGNVTISRVYYVEGLGHNLFSVGQFYDSNLKVAFRQHTCFIRNLEGVDEATIYILSRHGLVRGLPKLKFEKDHLCSACAMGKSKKKPHKPKSKDTNQEKLYLLHMDLCGPMRVASVNGKKSKDEALDFIIKFLKMIQVRLKVPVRRIKTYNGTEFDNQTLREYYEKVGISHETSVARSPQQNGVVERCNHTLIEAARTMLIYVKASLFLWAEAVATACYIQAVPLLFPTTSSPGLSCFDLCAPSSPTKFFYNVVFSFPSLLRYAVPTKSSPYSLASVPLVSFDLSDQS